MEQTPCPDRLLDDCGGAFVMGCIGGSAWHGVKGYRNAPRGFLFKTQGLIDGIRTRGPILGGQFAIWGGLFAAFDCGLSAFRGKEDWKNAVTAGALTSGVLAFRGGLQPFLFNCVFGGAILGVIEGLQYVFAHSMKGAEVGPKDPLLNTPFGLEGKAEKDKKLKEKAERIKIEKRNKVKDPELLTIDLKHETREQRKRDRLLLPDEIKYSL